jgi:hypothetical protein
VQRIQEEVEEEKPAELMWKQAEELNHAKEKAEKLRCRGDQLRPEVETAKKQAAKVETMEDGECSIVHQWAAKLKRAKKEAAAVAGML